MMDCPWYECAGPNSYNENDFKMIKEDFMEYQERRKIHNPFNLGPYLLDSIIAYQIHRMFKNASGCSWRGYGTFKEQIMYELSIEVFGKSVKFKRFRRFINKKHTSKQ